MTTYEPADWRPEPGDVAEVTWDGETARRILTDAGACSRDGWISNSAVERVRRLLLVDPASTVVLDPNDPDDCQRLYSALADSRDIVRDALRSLLPVATPPEPNGLGAVVKGTTADGSGATWVRAIRNGGPAVWALSIPDPAGRERWWLWSAMHVTEVLSHGVGCSCGAPDCTGGDQ